MFPPFVFSRLPTVLGDPSFVLQNDCNIYLCLASFDLLSPFYEDLDDNKIMFLGQRRQGDLFSAKLPLLHRIITLGSGKTSYSEFQTSLG